MDIFTVENLVWSLFFAVVAATVYVYFMQRSVCTLAGKLKDAGIHDGKSAKNLDELGYKSAFVKAAVGFFAENGGILAKSIVKIKNETESVSELLFEEQNAVKYYIPEENIDKRFEKHLKDKMSLPVLVAMLAVLTVIAFFGATVIEKLGDYAKSVADGNGDNAIGVEQQKDSLLEEQEKANKEEEKKKKEEEELAKLEEQAEKELAEALGKEEISADSESMNGSAETDGNDASIKETDKPE